MMINCMLNYLSNYQIKYPDEYYLLTLISFLNHLFSSFVIVIFFDDSILISVYLLIFLYKFTQNIS